MSEEELHDQLLWNIINTITDILFLIDIIVTFNTALVDEETYKLDQDRGRIAMEYLTGWFTLDFGAIIPFEAFIKS